MFTTILIYKYIRHIWDNVNYDVFIDNFNYDVFIDNFNHNVFIDNFNYNVFIDNCICTS